jgi:hypothetical protein
MRQPIVFESFYIFYIFLTYALATTSIAGSNLMYSISFNIKAHFRVLHKKVEAFNVDDDVSTARKKLAEFVKYHRKIEEWSLELDNIFLPITNGMSFYYAMLICNVAFQAVVLAVIIITIFIEIFEFIVLLICRI